MKWDAEAAPWEVIWKYHCFNGPLSHNNFLDPGFYFTGEGKEKEKKKKAATRWCIYSFYFETKGIISVI